MILVQLWAAQSDLSEGEHCSRQHNQLSHWKVFFIENFSTEGSSFLRKMSGNLEKKLSLEDDRFLLKTSLLKVKVLFIEKMSG